MTPNYSIYTIPIYWVLALWPHAHSMSIIQKNNNKRWNNVNPRGTGTVAAYKAAVPAAVFARYERGEAAHKNMMENAALYIGAVVIGNMAGLPAETLNTATAAYLASRLAYILLYLNTTSTKLSFFRSAVWASGLAILFTLLIKSGNKLR